jgi:hypothetical protein
MKILATDLDRTLLPNGRWPADPDAIKLFNELTKNHAVQVVYVTGRNLALSEDGVLVRNADDQLVARVKQAAATNPNLKLYFAKGDFKNLNGYYTSGVIEGAYHYGIFDK